MIKCKIDALVKEGGVSLKIVADAIGLPLVELVQLADMRASSINFSSLNLLCRFFCCQVGDLFEVV